MRYYTLCSVYLIYVFNVRGSGSDRETRQHEKRYVLTPEHATQHIIYIIRVF